MIIRQLTHPIKVDNNFKMDMNLFRGSGKTTYIHSIMTWLVESLGFHRKGIWGVYMLHFRAWLQDYALPVTPYYW